MRYDATIRSTVLTIRFLRSNAGARNFLFVNVPPIDRSPLVSITIGIRPECARNADLD